MDEPDDQKNVLKRLETDAAKRVDGWNGNSVDWIFNQLTPRHYYRWPLWKKLLLVPVGFAVLVALAVLRSQFRRY